MSIRQIVVSDAKGQRRWVQAFIRAATAKKYPASVTALAMALVELHFNRKTGQCNPGYPVLAAELGCDERTIIRAVKKLEAHEWIARRRAPGQHKKVEFTFTIPAHSEVTPAVTSEGSSEVTQNSSRGDNCCPPFNDEHLNTRNRVQHRPRPGVHQYAKREAESRAANEFMRSQKFGAVSITASSS